MSVKVKKGEIYIVKSGYYFLDEQSERAYHSFEVKLPRPEYAYWDTLYIQNVNHNNPFFVDLSKLNKNKVKHSLELDGEYGMILTFNQDATIDKYIEGQKRGGRCRQRNKRNTKRTSSTKYRRHRTRRATRRRRV